MLPIVKLLDAKGWAILRELQLDPAEAKQRRWICACDEMQKYKYCHCLLFVTEDGTPVTEYLPEDHEGRQAYGVVKDPHPDKGRPTAKVLEKQGRSETTSS